MGLTIQFMPHSEIADLDSKARVKKLLNVVMKNKVILLQGKLNPEEEANLIAETMTSIGRGGFKGIELSSLNTLDKLSSFARIRYKIAGFFAGRSDDLTIIGPASLIKEIKKDPRKIELMLR